MLLQSAFTFLCALGRIHSASVSGVDLDAQNVTVEWFEYGETKGKEVIGENVKDSLEKLFLNHSMPLVSFYTPRKHQQTLMFSI